MTDRPILFSAPMIRALLAGAKTQTRRIVKPQPTEEMRDTARANLGGDTHGATPVVGFMGTLGLLRSAKSHARLPHADTVGPGTGFIEPNIRCPYAHKRGDRLWVRETWGPCDGGSCYRADEHRDAKPDGGRWIPSIHMPRWASRITLEIVGVRVERLNDIGEADAIAEGLTARSKDGALVKYGIPDCDGLPGNDDHGWHWREWESDPRRAYRTIWESINGPGSWATNPLVWVIEFKRVEVTNV